MNNSQESILTYGDLYLQMGMFVEPGSSQPLDYFFDPYSPDDTLFTADITGDCGLNLLNFFLFSQVMLTSYTGKSQKAA
jgi:hypothetical protein